MQKIINLFVLLSILGLSGCGYNSLQVKEEKVFQAWADIESTLQRRADLILVVVHLCFCLDRSISA